MRRSFSDTTVGMLKSIQSLDEIGSRVEGGFVRIIHSVRIARPIDAVWAIVADPDTHPRWRPTLKEFRQVSDGPLAVGSKIREVLEWRGRTIEIDDVVTGFEPPYRFAVHGAWKAAEFDLDLLLLPLGDDATEVTFDWPLRPKTLPMKIAAPFLRRTMERATVEEADCLRRLAENAAL